ncbi:MAG: flagellar M-ring protein FliF [Verrucomicrobia subdivision 3 bacterium]|nr:flagellar M-ring protein FliF [Limisphaerales bacterium]
MNESLSQVGGQLQSIWKQLGVNQRLSLVLAAAVVLLGLGGLIFWSSRADYSLLYGKLDEAEAAKVIAALDDAKVPYKVSRTSGTISVPADKVHLMRMQLAAKGIPRGEGVGFEIFDKPNFGISDFIQRANYLRAVQGELARTISQVDSIESARVMIVMPENRLLVDNQKRPTASVFVRVRGSATLPPQNVNAIRFLVANAVEGLIANNVSVVDNQGNVLSDNTENDSVAGLTTTQLTARKNLEQYLAKKAEDILTRVLGAGQSVVRVSADINFDSLSRVEEKYDPEGQVIRISTINDENVETTNASANGGVPGVATNAETDTNAITTAAAPLNSNRTKKKVTNNQYEINRTVSNIMQTPGGLKRLSAAIFVAANVTGTGTNRVVTPRSPEEMKKIQHIVMGALGIQEGADALRQDQIAVEEMPFNEPLPVEAVQQFEKQQKQQFWWELAQNAVYPLLALGVLFVFWRTVKRMPADNIPLGVPIGKMTGNGHGLLNGNGHDRHDQGIAQPVPVTVDVLNQLIRENPNNMTQAIRSWMSAGKGK